jgi:hypothetical protein
MINKKKMAEKMRLKYMDVLKERNVLLSEMKRVRHDYELYVKQNDQVIIKIYFATA